VGTKKGGFSEAVRIQMLPPGADRASGLTIFIPEPQELPPPRILRLENTMDHSRTFRGFRNESLECRFTHSDSALDLSKVELTVDRSPWPLLSVERPAPDQWQVKASMRNLTPGIHRLRLRTRRSAYSEELTIDLQ
jgi:hypothetical protein